MMRTHHLNFYIIFWRAAAAHFKCNDVRTRQTGQFALEHILGVIAENVTSGLMHNDCGEVQAVAITSLAKGPRSVSVHKQQIGPIARLACAREHVRAKRDADTLSIYNNGKRFKMVERIFRSLDCALSPRHKNWTSERRMPKQMVPPPGIEPGRTCRPTSLLSWPVYQFRHGGVCGRRGFLPSCRVGAQRHLRTMKPN